MGRKKKPSPHITYIMNQQNSMTQKKSVLFVCLGNICRSPTAEGICRKVANNSNLLIESACTSSFHQNEMPDDRSQEICYKNNIDISTHRARLIRHNDFSRFDIIVALDENIFQILKSKQPKSTKAKLVLFNEPNGIADPYYGGRTDFRKMFNQIQDSMDKFLRDNGLIL